MIRAVRPGIAAPAVNALTIALTIPKIAPEEASAHKMVSFLLNTVNDSHTLHPGANLSTLPLAVRESFAMQDISMRQRISSIAQILFLGVLLFASACSRSGKAI